MKGGYGRNSGRDEKSDSLEYFFLSIIISQSGEVARGVSGACKHEFKAARSRPGQSASRFAYRLYYGRGSSINRIEARRAKSSRAHLNRSLRTALSHGLVRSLVSDNVRLASRSRTCFPLLFYFFIATHICVLHVCARLCSLLDGR